jgi:hypothetical protein
MAVWAMTILLIIQGRSVDNFRFFNGSLHRRLRLSKGSVRPALCNRCLPLNAVGRQPIRERTFTGSGWVLVMFWHSGACSLVHRARCQVNQDARSMVSVWLVKSCFYQQRRLVLMNSFAMAAAGHNFWRSRAMARAFWAIFFSFMLLSSFAARAAAGPLEDAAAFERRDFATAVRLLRPLADQGNAEAQMKLGFMYAAGEGIRRDYVEALKWFRLAADQGQANAQCFLGLMYFEGRGVPQDYVSAYMWLNLAVAGGIEDAAEYRHALTAKMTPAQVAEAQRLARERKSGRK